MLAFQACRRSPVFSGSGSFIPGTGLSPAPTLLGAPLSTGDVSPNPSPPAPGGSMSAASSLWLSARPPRNRSGSSHFMPFHPDQSCGAARPGIRRAGTGGFPLTNRFAKGLRPSRRQGFPQVSLRCNLGDSPPLTLRPRARRLARFHAFCMSPFRVKRWIEGIAFVWVGRAGWKADEPDSAVLSPLRLRFVPGNSWLEIGTNRRNAYTQQPTST